MIRETVDVPLESLADQLTDAERADLTGGFGPWWTTPVPRLGVPSAKTSDGMVGVRGERFVGTSSTCFPCGTALGATWDPDLVRRVGDALGEEARRKHVAVLLAPVLNLHRHPLAGRNFESFGEDPYLAGRLGVAYIRGVQAQGVAAVAKHFVANDAEVDRERVEACVDETTLREVYLAPFEAAVREGKVWAVMSAYNKLNGTYCSEHPWLLGDVLRGEWGFDGIVVSDWGGTHSSAASLVAGLDLEMPGPPRQHGRRLLETLADGERWALAESAARMLRLLDRIGATGIDARAEESSEEPSDIRRVAREAAEQAIVLLSNDGTLPVTSGSVRRVAVVGPLGVDTPVQGGGSAFVNPHDPVGIFDGLRAALGPTVEVVHERGVGVSKHAPLLVGDEITTPGGQPGMHVEYRAADDGTLLGSQVLASTSLLSIGPPVERPMGDIRVRTAARFRATASGIHTFGLMSAGDTRVRIDGREILDSRGAPRGGEAFFGRSTQEITARVELEEGTEHVLEVDVVPIVEKSETLGFLLGCWRPVDPAAIDRAVALARDADVAIVAVGTTAEHETEGGDRDALGLPGDQDELVRRVAAVNPRTVVVLVCGAAVATPWIDDVAACLVAWFGGQEVGTAVARVVLGKVEPSGRLPVTFPRDAGQLPDLGFDGTTITYHEGTAFGYRRYLRDGLAPAFPFGHGLAYTTFRSSEARGSRDGDGITVEVRIENIGERRGVAVVQAYAAVADTHDSPRLAAFARVDLEPGAAEVALLHLGGTQLRRWDAASRSWVLPVGLIEVSVGWSATAVEQVLQV
jgi:beta-glucosidase